MEKIIKQLFGFTAANRQVYEFKPGVRTTAVKESLTFEQWCQEFRVSMAHGKSIVHFG
jgi:hypothetical protein